MATLRNTAMKLHRLNDVVNTAEACRESAFDPMRGLDLLTPETRWSLAT